MQNSECYYKMVTDRYGADDIGPITERELHDACRELDWPDTIYERDGRLYDERGLVAISLVALVREVRRENSWTTQQMGKEMGVSARTVEGWEQGRPISGPAIRLLRQLKGRLE